MPIGSDILDSETSTQTGIEPLVRALAENNPYRVLGIYSNSTKKEQLANVSRMAAFLRVQRQISFPTDNIGSLQAPLRTEESVNNASAAIALPAQRLRHALFWFLCSTQEDNEALTKLALGENATAEETWKTADGASSLHNLALLYFFTEHGEKAVPLLERLYAEYTYELGQLIDESLSPTESELIDSFLSELASENPYAVSAIAPYISKDKWKDRLSQYETERLLLFIKDCDEYPGTTAEERLEASQELARKSAPILQNLKLLLGDKNPAYTNLADQVATQILQGAIYYYNKSDETLDVISVSLRVMKLARKVARGKAVRTRCNDNISTVQSVMNELPTDEMGTEGQEVYSLIKAMKHKAPTIGEVRAMLNITQPYLKALKERLGKQHSAYLGLSSLVVKHALLELVDVLNNALKRVNEAAERLQKFELPYLGLRTTGYGEMRPLAKEFYSAKSKVTSLLHGVWTIVRELEFYDMAPDCRRDIYNKRRSEIELLCHKASVQTDYFSDSLRRHPVSYSLAAVIIMALVSLFGWFVYAVQSETGELQTLVRKAETKEDWQNVAEVAKAASLSSYRHQALRSATAELKKIEEEENEHSEAVGELMSQFQRAESLDAFESFVTDVDAYLEKYGEERCPDMAQRKQEAELRIKVLKEERLRKQVASLIEQYRAAKTKNELQSFVNAANILHTQDEELGKCYTQAQARIDELKAAELKEKEEALLARFEQASTVEEFEAVAADAKAVISVIPSMAKLSLKATDKAEELRLKAKQEEIKRLWGTEANAWATVQRENTLAACRTYLQYYPKGKHAEQASKRIIDSEVDGVFASGEYGQLPTAQRTRYSRSTTTSITVTNDTEYTLTIMYSGPGSSKKLEIPSRGTRSVTLPSATYKVVASVNSSRVRPFAGSQTYSGGGYEVTYYISTSPAIPSYRYSSSPDYYPF